MAVKDSLLKTYHHTYESEFELLAFIEQNSLIKFQENIFIQACVSNWTKLEIEHLRYILLDTLPKAIFYAVESSNVENDSVSFTIFKNIDQKSFIIHENMSLENQYKLTGMLAVTTKELSKLRTIEKKMERIAYFDLDTGLPNRVRFDEILVERLKLAKLDKKSLTVMFLDLDRFKLINDMLGHQAGDIVLKELANRISLELPKRAQLGRFSGDKFSIILPYNSKPDYALRLGNKLMRSIQKPFIFEKKEFFVTASFGISMYPFDGSDNVVLMKKNADSALNRAKDKGGNAIVFYANEINKETLAGRA